jgi:predicted nuclease of predicted toxin-antitoxin system
VIEGSQEIRVLLDEGVPDSVGNAFSSNGHEVILHRDVLAQSATDELVCQTALINAAILVAQDKDMRQIAKRFGSPSMNNRFSRLNLIRICCEETQAAKRILQAISFIEHEWKFSCEKVARRLWVDIGAHFLKSNR